jgi:hypothetical protein
VCSVVRDDQQALASSRLLSEEEGYLLECGDTRCLDKKE